MRIAHDREQPPHQTVLCICRSSGSKYTVWIWPVQQLVVGEERKWPRDVECFQWAVRFLPQPCNRLVLTKKKRGGGVKRELSNLESVSLFLELILMRPICPCSSLCQIVYTDDLISMMDKGRWVVPVVTVLSSDWPLQPPHFVPVLDVVASHEAAQGGGGDWHHTICAADIESSLCFHLRKCSCYNIVASLRTCQR